MAGIHAAGPAFRQSRIGVSIDLSIDLELPHECLDFVNGWRVHLGAWRSTNRYGAIRLSNRSTF